VAPLLADFRVQAEVCAEHGSPMYADVLERIAADLNAGGLTADLLAPFAVSRSPDAVPLRLMGSVHRLVLQRRAGALATFYPSVGGRWESESGWAAFREFLERESALVAQSMVHPPQTNEVGRSAALMGGLLSLPEQLRLPIRLRELGSSAGLNLLVDRFAFQDSAGRAHGAADARLAFANAWTGRELVRWPDLTIIDRAGCDTLPIDPRSTEGRLALTAYVWADQIERFERLRAAFALAADVHVEVHDQSAADFVAGLTLTAGTTTVVWHSVMWQYLALAEQQAIDRDLQLLGEQATPDAPLARIWFEPTGRRPEERGIYLQTWSGDGGNAAVGRATLIGTAPPHGLPCEWT
jgi:hypothetical protein